KLLDYPGLILAVVFLVFTAVGYLLSATPRLFLILALVVIGTITTVYVGIFEPGQIGWGSTYTFDGILVATLVMVLFDTLIWVRQAKPGKGGWYDLKPFDGARRVTSPAR